MKKIYLNTLLLLIGLLFSELAQASLFETQSKTDNAEPIYISSETGEFNRETGIDIYRIDVQIDQGNTHVTGAIVTTKSLDNKLEEAIIEGDMATPARYKSRPDPQKPDLVATANVIKFYPKQDLIILLGKASIIQGTNSIKGEHLEYDVKKQTLKSMAVSSTEGKKSRTMIVFTPETAPKNMTTTLNPKAKPHA